MNRVIRFHLILSLSVFSLLSCTRNNCSKPIKIIKNFPRIESLKGSDIPEIKNDFFALQMGLIDSLLILCDYENNPHFHIYHLPDFENLGNFGKQGKGPTDISSPVFWGQTKKIDNSYYMWFFQMDLMKQTYINIFKYINDGKSTPEKTIEMPPEIDMSVNIITLNDSIMIGTGSGAKGEFFVYNINSDFIRWQQFDLCGTSSKFAEILKNNNLLSEYRLGKIKIKPDKSRFVKSYIYSPFINIYDENTKLLFSIGKDKYSIPEINKNGEFSQESEIYYSNIFLSNNFIYALNQNCKLKEMNNSKDVEIEVFDWDGNAVCKYRLNEGIIASGAFVIDEINNMIYTVYPKNDSSYYSRFIINNVKF